MNVAPTVNDVTTLKTTGLAENPSFANTPFGMVPVLSYQKEEPGLALGYKLPAIHLALTVVG